MEGRNLLVGTIIVVIILYMFVKTQPKTIPQPNVVEDVSKSGEEKFTISQIARIASLKKRKATPSHRTSEQFTNFDIVADNFQSSIEPSMRRSSPVKGSRRYSDSGRQDIAGSSGFITVI